MTRHMVLNSLQDRSSAVSTVLSILTATFLLTAIAGCSNFGGSDDRHVFDYNFSTSTHQWEAFFTDHPVGEEEDMELTADHRPLPASIDSSSRGLYVHSFNQSDDVKMLFRRQVSGLKPNATYQVQVAVRFATSAPSGCSGIGGPPGEAVKVIAAASDVKPKQFVEEKPTGDWYRLNVQHQDDPHEWYNEAILGNIANSRQCEEKEVFELKTLASEGTHDTVTADENGEAWLLFGTRSGYEGRTTLYYTNVQAVLHR